jgi:hypothetical protein
VRHRNSSKGDFFYLRERFYKQFSFHSVGTANDEDAILVLNELMEGFCCQRFSFFDEEDFLKMSVFLFKGSDDMFGFLLDNQIFIFSFKRFQSIKRKLFAEAFFIFSDGRGEMFIRVGNMENGVHRDN